MLFEGRRDLITYVFVHSLCMFIRDEPKWPIPRIVHSICKSRIDIVLFFDTLTVLVTHLLYALLDV